MKISFNALPLLASVCIIGLGFLSPELLHKLHLDHLKQEIVEHGYHELQEHRRAKRRLRKRLGYV